VVENRGNATIEWTNDWYVALSRSSRLWFDWVSSEYHRGDFYSIFCRSVFRSSNKRVRLFFCRCFIVPLSLAAESPQINSQVGLYATLSPSTEITSLHHTSTTIPFWGFQEFLSPDFQKTIFSCAQDFLNLSEGQGGWVDFFCSWRRRDVFFRENLCEWRFEAMKPT
jgi:hypothetical protein